MVSVTSNNEIVEVVQKSAKGGSAFMHGLFPAIPCRDGKIQNIITEYMANVLHCVGI
jgi:hypothetical protein